MAEATPRIAPVARVRPASVLDLPAMAAIERASFADPWSEPMFRDSLASPARIVLVAEDADGAVQGFAVAQSAAGDADVLDIAVLPAARGRGVGAALLRAALVRCVESGADQIALEVRESNVAARALYTRLGFTEVGRRKRYYQAPVEDGLLMHRSLRCYDGLR